MLLERRAGALDPVASSRMIAKSLIANFRSGPPVDADRLNIENVLRQLKKYELKLLHSYRPIGMVDRVRTTDLNERLAASSAGRLQGSLDQVRQLLAPEESATEFAGKLRSSLEALRDRRASEDEIGAVKAFLEAWATKLEAI